MKRLGFIVLAMFSCGVYAQEPKFAPVDTSPADIVYFPLNAAKAKDDSKPLVKLVYSRPTKKGREIFGVLEQFEKVWRLGANESTEIKFYKHVRIGGKRIKAGTYSLFAIPGREKWTFIVNKQVDRWGAFSYDASKDLVRIEVPVIQLLKPMESFSMTFVTQTYGADLTIGWDTTMVQVPIQIK